jgi:hypothetical protein
VPAALDHAAERVTDPRPVRRPRMGRRNIRTSARYAFDPRSGSGGRAPASRQVSLPGNVGHRAHCARHTAPSSDAIKIRSAENSSSGPEDGRPLPRHGPSSGPRKPRTRPSWKASERSRPTGALRLDRQPPAAGAVGGQQPRSLRPHQIELRLGSLEGRNVGGPSSSSATE